MFERSKEQCPEMVKDIVMRMCLIDEIEQTYDRLKWRDPERFEQLMAENESIDKEAKAIFDSLTPTERKQWPRRRSQSHGGDINIAK
jgi:hypothetical protein